MPTPLGRLTWTGKLPAGEVFSFGFAVLYAAGGDMSITDLATAGDQWLGTFLTGATPANALFPSTLAFNPCRAETIEVATGKVLEQRFGTTAGVGTASSAVANLPPGVATAVTLRATSGLGVLYGRFFLPPPIASTAGTTGRWASASFTTLTGALGNAFTAMTGRTPSMVAAVYSKQHAAAFATNEGDVGDVFDSMRTRRDKLVEARTTIFTH